MAIGEPSEAVRAVGTPREQTISSLKAPSRTDSEQEMRVETFGSAVSGKLAALGCRAKSPRARSIHCILEDFAVADPTSPDGRPEKIPVGVKTERSVDQYAQTDQRRKETESEAPPKSDEHATNHDQGAEHGRADDENLSPKKPVGEQAAVSRADRFGLWTMIATVALAVATLVLALATADMARSTRKLAGFARQQAHDTQDALAAAGRQASAAEEANRLTRNPTLSINAVVLPAPTANTTISASYQVINTGRSSARNVIGQAAVQILPNFQVPLDINPCDHCSMGGLLYPSTGFQNLGLTFNGSLDAKDVTEDTISALDSGYLIAYLLGRVDYVDVDGKRHKMLLCVQYKPQNRSVSPCSNGGNSED